jgi:hypothetical protein
MSSYVIILCHNLSPPVIIYHHLSSFVIIFHHLSSSIIIYHQLSSTIINYHQLPLTIIIYLPVCRSVYLSIYQSTYLPIYIHALGSIKRSRWPKRWAQEYLSVKVPSWLLSAALALGRMRIKRPGTMRRGVGASKRRRKGNFLVDFSRDFMVMFWWFMVMFWWFLGIN